MTSNLPEYPKETILERRVTLTLTVKGKVYLFENVPAQVVLETGEELFAPETLDQIQELIRNEPKPIRTVETSVYQLA